MKKLGWYALRVTVAALVLGGLLLLAANLYVQSHSVQQRIRGSLEAALKLPVSLRKTTLTPWDGLRLDGLILRSQNPASGEASGADFFTAGSFRVRFAWWSLLAHQQVVIEQVFLDEPRLNWDGRPIFPPEDRSDLVEAGPPSAPGSVGPPGESTDSPLPPGAVPSTRSGVLPGAPEDAAAVEPPPNKGFPVRIGKMRLRHGQADYVDNHGQPLVRVEDVNLDGSIDDPHRAGGALWFGQASSPLTGLTLTNYWTAIDYDDAQGLTLRDGRGSIAGGRLKTAFHLGPQEDGPTFSFRGSLNDLALAQVVRVAPGQPPFAVGRMYGELECHGATNDPASRAGGGRIWLDGAKLQEFPLMKLVGQLLRITDLSQTEFKQAEIDYKVEGTILRIDSFILAANDIRIVARGQFFTDEDRLDLHGRLTIDHAVSHQLPQFIESNFTVCGNESPGCRFLDFDVTGPAENPKCNLYDRMMAGQMKGMLDNLLSPKPKAPRNKRREVAPVAPAAPTTLSAPAATP